MRQEQIQEQIGWALTPPHPEIKTTQDVFGFFARLLNSLHLVACNDNVVYARWHGVTRQPRALPKMYLRRR